VVGSFQERNEDGVVMWVAERKGLKMADRWWVPTRKGFCGARDGAGGGLSRGRREEGEVNWARALTSEHHSCSQRRTEHTSERGENRWLERTEHSSEKETRTAVRQENRWKGENILKVVREIEHSPKRGKNRWSKRTEYMYPPPPPREKIKVVRQDMTAPKISENIWLETHRYCRPEQTIK
jgi:hypothetical protein